MGLPEGSPSFFAFFAQWRPSRSFTPVAPSCPCARLPAFCTPSCPRPCNRRNASSFSMSLHAGGLPSAHLVSFSMSLRTSAWGPCKGVPFAGREAPREHMADFGATRGVAIRVPVGKLYKACCCWGKIVALFVFALSATLCYVLPQEMRIATSLRSSQSSRVFTPR